MKISKRGIALFLSCCTGLLGLGLFSLPTAAAYFGSTVYWLYLLCAMLLALLAAALFSAAFPDTFAKTCQTCFPKFAKLLSIAYMLFCTLTTALLFAYYAHTVQGWFLDMVPRAGIALFLILICLLTAAKPLRTILCLVGVCAAFVLPTILIMRCIMLFSGDVRNLLPLWESAQLKNLPDGILFMAGFFALPSIVGSLRLPKRTKFFASGGAIIFCFALFCLATAACISILGPTQAARHLSSTVLAMKNLRLTKLDFFRRADMIFILTWSVLILSAGSLSAHIPFAALRSLCPRIKNAPILIAFFALYAVVACSIPSEETALHLYIYTSLIGGAVFYILLPPVILIKRRFSREKNH